MTNNRALLLFNGEKTNSDRRTRNGRADNCPLVPVPEHGRLIDADAMIRDIEKSFAPSWYIKERNADMVKFLSLEDTIIPADPADKEEE